MPRFGVTPEKEQQLLARMAACGLDERELEERFVRGSGPGGQKINRTAVCVCLTHRPTGLSVKSQHARSQAQNRFFARRRLCELLELRIAGADSPLAKQQQRIGKQKARRRRRTIQKLQDARDEANGER